MSGLDAYFFIRYYAIRFLIFFLKNIIIVPLK